MANHVYFNIDIEGLTEEQWEPMFKSEVVKRKHWKEGEPDIEFNELAEVHEQPFMSDVPKEYDEDGWIKDSYNWYINNCGAKWVTIESWEYSYLSGYSAWSTPCYMVENMLGWLSRTYNTVVSAKMTYEDEFRNFIGVDYFETWCDEDTGEWEVTHSENYLDGEELNDKVKELLGIEDFGTDFEWFDPMTDKDGNEVTPSELQDDLVYGFFEKGEL